MQIKKIASIAVALAGVMLGVSQAYAGTPGPGSITTTGGTAVLVTSETGSITGKNALNQSVFTANTFSGVYRESGGNLDFVYQFLNNGASTIETASATNFLGTYISSGQDTLAADQYYTTNNVSMGVLGSYELSDGTVDFSFQPGGVAANKTSYLLVVRTNATQYTAGSFQLQDGGNGSTPAYMPLTAAPEPSSVAAFAFAGVGALGLMLRARKSRGSMAS
jgi:hypothetical protein